MSQLDKAKEMLAVQGESGNWNYDPYMHGMYNGMEFIVALMEDREPSFKDAPDTWLADIQYEPKVGDAIPSNDSH